ncbi:MAG: pantetheine-phosphate adenylyltransferase [Clostridiales bacterium]|nr:pantetheine-phosphate adenylyltransferase [Clostridiales bacterium]
MRRIAVCPGSFDPITLGHLDVITRTAKMFDKVLVVVMTNFRKPTGSFTVAERMDFIKRCTSDLPNVIVDSYDGLLFEYVESRGAIAIVKGLRAVSDFEDEFKQALTNKILRPSVETIFMVTSSEYMFLSSSVVKEVCGFGGDISAFVPEVIREDIIKRIGKGGKTK